MKHASETNSKVSVLKDHVIAWATFLSIFALAMNSPTAQQSFDQSARNQITVQQDGSHLAQSALNPLSKLTQVLKNTSRQSD